ncbi:MAG: 16S rRNA (cytosine(1402)-N(4))-methyltransferase RsmH [Candidatus Magasanikbacteria bacterium]
MSRHVPVLLREVVDSLQLKAGAKVIDCTLGDAGHSEVILEKIGPKGKLLGIDADPESLFRAKRNLYNFGSQVIFVRDNFVNLKEIIKANNFENADAILIDLGWSTPQFKERSRGFSFEGDEPLDMRYNGVSGESAADVINQYSEAELEKILRFYGEEKLSREIAKEIVGSRAVNKIEHTAPLVEIILGVYRRKLKTEKEIPWVGGIHPATKVFQALRIAVNSELEVIRQVLPQAIESLSVGGRLAVITFHSLEDRIVKQFFVKNQNKTLKIINKKPIIASEEEVENNPSSRSAKLRIIEKL